MRTASSDELADRRRSAIAARGTSRSALVASPALLEITRGSRELKNADVFFFYRRRSQILRTARICELLHFFYFSLYTGSTMKKITAVMVTSAVCGVILFASCRTVKDIPEDLTSTQLIQLGQNAYGSAQYKNAEIYYKTVIARYGIDSSVYVEARYELGHLYLKQKKYAAAYASFKEILDMYASTTPGVLPGAYNKLAEIGMQRIPKNKLPETKASEVQTERTDAAAVQQTRDAETKEENANTANEAAQKSQTADAQESQTAESPAEAGTPAAE